MDTKSYLNVNDLRTICSISVIIWDFISSLASADYLNMTVSNKATLDTVHFSLMIIISYFVVLLSYTCVNVPYSVKQRKIERLITHPSK